MQKGDEHLVLIEEDDFKQSSCQWHMKVNCVVTFFCFVENVVNQCFISRSEELGGFFFVLVLYVDSILLASSIKFG